jgi:hypothetical protein
LRSCYKQRELAAPHGCVHLSRSVVRRLLLLLQFFLLLQLAAVAAAIAA